MNRCDYKMDCMKTLDPFIFIILAALVIWSSVGVYLFYSKNGDLKHIYRIEKDGEVSTSNLYDKIREHYKTEEEVIDRLNQLVMYHTHVVKWPYYILLTTIISILILIVIRSFSWINLVITFLVVYTGLVLSDHWFGTHIYGAHETESIFLNNLYREMKEKKEKKEKKENTV